MRRPIPPHPWRPERRLSPGHHVVGRRGFCRLEPAAKFTVKMVNNGVPTPLTNPRTTFFAVPTNVGPRTMPNYAALAAQGIYSLGNGIRVFAGTVDDPFYIDLGRGFRYT